MEYRKERMLLKTVLLSIVSAIKSLLLNLLLLQLTFHLHSEYAFATVCDGYKDVKCASDEIGDTRIFNAKKGVVRLKIERDLITNVDCTGFLIKDYDETSDIAYILTAGHCLDQNDRSITVIFGDESSECENNTVYKTINHPKYYAYIASKMIGAIEKCEPDERFAEQKDWAIVQLGAPLSHYGVNNSEIEFLELMTEEANSGDKAFLIHHPGGDKKKFSKGNFLTDNDPFVFFRSFDYDNDFYSFTEGGSSGCPVFNQTKSTNVLKVQGIFVCGGSCDEPYPLFRDGHFHKITSINESDAFNSLMNPSIAKPYITLVNIPESGNTGEPIILEIKVKNIGDYSSTGYIHLEIPQFDSTDDKGKGRVSVESSSFDSDKIFIFENGQEIPHRTTNYYDGNQANYLHLEAKDDRWEINEEHFFVLKIYPEATGTIDILYRAAIQSENQYYYNSPSDRDLGENIIGSNASSQAWPLYKKTISINNGSPPQITSGPTVPSETITSHSAIVTWNTDIPSNSIVEYGKTIAYGNHLSEEDPVIGHSILLQNLEPNQTYRFMVRSENEYGADQSGDFVFTTSYSEADHLVIVPEIPTGSNIFDAFTEGGQNFGYSGSIKVGNTPDQFGFIKFSDTDIAAAIPMNAEIISAHLNLYKNVGNICSAGYLNAYRITQQWDENTVDYPAHNLAFDSVNAFQSSPLEAAAGWTQIDITDLLTQWRQGQLANNGLILLPQNDGQPHCFEFFSSDINSVEKRPYLSVQFNDPLCSPETCNGLDDDCDGQIDEGLECGHFCAEQAHYVTDEGKRVFTELRLGPYCANGYAWREADIDLDGYLEKYMLVGETYTVWASAGAQTINDSIITQLYLNGQPVGCYDGDCDSEYERARYSKFYGAPTNAIEYPRFGAEGENATYSGYAYMDGGTLSSTYFQDTNHNGVPDDGESIRQENHLVVRCGQDCDCFSGYYCEKPNLGDPKSYLCVKDTTAPQWLTSTGVQQVVQGALPNQIIVKWNGASDRKTNTYYNIYYHTQSPAVEGVKLKRVSIQTDEIFNYQYTINGLQGDRTYYVTVRAEDENNNEDANTIELSIDLASPPPNGLTASDGLDFDKIHLTWNMVSWANAYEVWRGTTDDTAVAKRIADTQLLTFDDHNVLPGKTYYYWVKAKSSSLASEFSATDPGFRAYELMAAEISDHDLSGGFYVPYNVKIHDHYAYVVGKQRENVQGSYQYDSYLSIVDIADAAHPVLVKKIKLETKDFYGAYAVDIQDGFLFISNYHSGTYNFTPDNPVNRNNLAIYQITDPVEPVLVGRLNELGYYADIFVRGEYIYAAGGFHNDYGLSIINFNNYSNPTVTSFIELGDYVNDVEIAGNLAYISSLSGVRVVDITDPRTPFLVANISSTEKSQGILISENVLYVITRSKFMIFDLTDPQQPVFISELNVGVNDHSVFSELIDTRPISKLGEFIYTSVENNLIVINCRTLSAPTLQHQLDASMYLHSFDYAFPYLFCISENEWISEFIGYDVFTGGNLPQPPPAVAANRGESPAYIKVEWAIESNSYTLSYEVWRSETNDIGTAQPITQGIEESVYYDTSAEAGKTYYYWIKPVNYNGVGPFSVSSQGSNYPVSFSETITLPMNTSIAITLKAADEDNDALVYSVSELPQHGSLAGGYPQAIYTPQPGFIGTDEIAFFASDGTHPSNSARIVFTVIDPNQPPLAQSINVFNPVGTGIDITLVAGDPEGDELEYEILNLPQNGILTGQPPNLQYISSPDYAGKDFFEYRVHDGKLSSGLARVEILTIKPAQDYFVAPAPIGDDAHDGLTPQTPLATLARALVVANATEQQPAKIKVAAGRYIENIALRDWVILAGGYNQDFSRRWQFDHIPRQIPDAFKTTIDGNSAGHGITVENAAEFCMIDGVTITNGRSVSGGGLYLKNSVVHIHNSSIINNVASAFGGGIYSYNSKVSIANTRIAGNVASSGGGLHHSNGYGSFINISNGLMYNNAAPVNERSSEIYLAGYGVAVSLLNTTVYDSADSAISVNLGDLIAKNTIFWQGTDIGETIIVNPKFSNGLNGRVLLNYCDIRSPEYGGIRTNFNAPPRFVDAENENFHLLTDSPCLDTGDPLFDYYRETQPDGGRINLGAFGNTLYSSNILFAFTDTDDDGVMDLNDLCPDNPEKLLPGSCGCGNIEEDTDADGLQDCIDAFPADVSEWEDTDQDGIGNNADLDDDGDGRKDVTDAFPTDPNEWLDSDADGGGDNVDLDDDNDGVPDVADECPLDFNKTKAGVCGCDSEDVDLDQDRLADCIDPFPDDADSDDDGLLDGVEDKNANGLLDPGETDPCDADTDNDGLQDGTETGITSDDIGPDTDHSVFVPDADSATVTDPINADSDGDLIPDGIEDINKNGRVDDWEPDPTEATMDVEPDLDDDGDIDGHDLALFADFFDPLIDQNEFANLAAMLGQTGFPVDSDRDGILTDGDFSGVAGDSPCTGGQALLCDDNCPAVLNTDQVDENANGIGDACENTMNDCTNTHLTGYWGDAEWVNIASAEDGDWNTASYVRSANKQLYTNHPYDGNGERFWQFKYSSSGGQHTNFQCYDYDSDAWINVWYESSVVSGKTVSKPIPAECLSAGQPIQLRAHSAVNTDYYEGLVSCSP